MHSLNFVRKSQLETYDGDYRQRTSSKDEVFSSICLKEWACEDHTALKQAFVFQLHLSRLRINYSSSKKYQQPYILNRRYVVDLPFKFFYLLLN